MGSLSERQVVPERELRTGPAALLRAMRGEIDGGPFNLPEDIDDDDIALVMDILTTGTHWAADERLRELGLRGFSAKAIQRWRLSRTNG